ncbi:RICIN domain-containing protein [Bacillus mycoides]|uniref:RICIN domain-containing protein n=1 Tax=Bacillus mycoides TaxID=1405 RepID=UPI0025A051AC|nr:RICIN domain-containing protein [Bacillus mycoides]MDM5430932.1 RICIN domain-containing protein [Bacillus mycoides]
MKKLFKLTGKKVIPVTAALSILVSAAPIAENTAQAVSARSIAKIMSISITSLGMVRNMHDKVVRATKHSDMPTYDGPFAENVSYKAPSFQTGEFNISMYHTQNDLNFEKPVKLLRPNGEIKTYHLKSGQELKITEAGTIVDLNPDENSVENHDFLYITQAQLDEGKTGVALNQEKTIYVEKTSGQNDILVNEFYKQKFGQNSLDGLQGLNVDRFSYLTAEQKLLATLTSHPVGKEVLTKYMTNNSQAQADFNTKKINLLPNLNPDIDKGDFIDDHVNYVNVKEGTYHIISGLNNTSVVDMSRNVSNRNIHLYGNHGGSNQKWVFEYDTKNGAYQIKSYMDKNLVLTWNNNDGSDNAFTTINTKTSEQYWILEDAGQGYVYIKNKKNPNKVLDIQRRDSSDGTNIIVYDKNNGWNQSFKLKKIQDEYVSATQYSNNHYEKAIIPFGVDHEGTQKTYRIISAKNTKSALEMYAGHEQSNAINLQPVKNDAMNQNWRFIYNPNKRAYEILNNNELSTNPNTYSLCWSESSNRVIVSRLYNNVTNNDANYWTIEDAGEGYVYFRNKLYPNRVLSMSSGVVLNGATPILSNYNGQSYQKFKIQQKTF